MTFHVQDTFVGLEEIQSKYCLRSQSLRDDNCYSEWNLRKVNGVVSEPMESEGISSTPIRELPVHGCRGWSAGIACCNRQRQGVLVSLVLLGACSSGATPCVVTLLSAAVATIEDIAGSGIGRVAAE